MKPQSFSTDFGGKKLEVTLGELAQQADGSCQVRYGGTTVLVTAVMAKEPKDGDYFPLMVDYEEKFYAAGRIKGSRFIKREGRPSEDAILTARLIDRSIRPRFDQRIRNDVQIVATVLSFDRENDPDVAALFGASLALMISDIPFDGPISGIRVGRNGKPQINPTYKEREASDYDIIAAGTDDKINMFEIGANIVPEKDILDGIALGFKEIQKLNKFQKDIAKKVGKEKRDIALHEITPDLIKKIKSFLEGKAEKAIYIKDRKERYDALGKLEEELKGSLMSEYEEHMDDIEHVFHEEADRIVHENVLEKDKRPDGRKLDEIRPVVIKAGAYPHTHGMGLFQRGETQVMSVLTLAAPSNAQLIDTMEEIDTKKTFMHHYGFPPYSVGETGRIGGTGRREIGHGALAEKALRPLIPSIEEFPYTIRMVSETLSSNGSSSMASVCGSSLALMDGGAPIKEHIAGIAMGLMLSSDGKKYKILTDIQGHEDHYGDMDFKVAGTKDGVTAIQMDVKIEGIDLTILEEGLNQAKKARLELLDKMNKVIDKPRKELFQYAPRVTSMKIDPEKNGAVIGPGGKVINGIIERTGAEIDIEQDGTVMVITPSKEGMAAALKEIELLTKEAKEGDIYEGTVVSLKDFGAFVEILPGTDGLLHVSEISEERIKTPADVLKMGQKVAVKVKKIDEHGKISLTMKF
jgi:polyribonucleotide nucleotidyltransferase